MTDDAATLELPAEAQGAAPGRGRLAGRRILVVGGGQRPNDDPDDPIGNGRAMCLLAAREGATVAVADIDRPSAEATVRLITREGGTAVALEADAMDPAQVETMVAGTLTTLGGIDGLVLNVGAAFGMRLEGTGMEEWDRTMALNVRSHFLACKSALPRMEAHGAVVFISSVAGVTPGSQMPAYDASKSALFGLCRHVALEGRQRGIRANVVVPGLIDTPLGRLATRGRPSRGRARIPLGRQGTGWEIAYATIFLLSNEASYITGQSFIVDGGVSALM